MIHKPICQYFGTRHEVTHLDPPGDSISQGAYDMISTAWREHHDVDPPENEVLNIYDIGKDRLVKWVQSPTYYFASFRSHVPDYMTGETDEAAWVEPEEVVRSMFAMLMPDATPVPSCEAEKLPSDRLTT